MFNQRLQPISMVLQTRHSFLWHLVKSFSSIYQSDSAVGWGKEVIEDVA
jgi:hypothetical protein